MRKVLISLLIVGLFSSFVVLPTFGQESNGVALSERIYQDQYGPFIDGPQSNLAASSSGFLNSAPSSLHSYNTTTAPKSCQSQTVPGSSRLPDSALQTNTGTHQLGFLWQSVDPKKQAPDSPWVDVR